MTEFKDKTKDLAGNAEDIARDKLDSFMNLSREQQILIIVFAVLLAIVATYFFTRPTKLNVVVDMLKMGHIEDMNNELVLKNNENVPLKDVTLVLNGKYEFATDEVGIDETINISVTLFRRIGKPNGKAPPGDTPLNSIELKADCGVFIKNYVK